MKKKKTSQTGKPRAPIVTILGHVDHGKTTLLDYIRKSKVQAKEAGGITQSIGASVVEIKASGPKDLGSGGDAKKITFIDTPGHAAFSKMRSRGADVADIAILVVAANDGVKPQTKEALSFIKDANVPLVVAATKMDLPSASAETVKSQLEKEGVVFEGSGGNVPLIPVSAKTGKGVDELLEMVGLVAEVNEIKADPQGELEAVVIETDKDKRGSLASVVVRNGTLNVGDEICARQVCTKIRGLFDSHNKPTKEIGPGEPALILGFSKLPPVGSKVINLKDRSFLPQAESAKRTMQNVGEDQRAIVVKASSAGSLEAVLAGIPLDFAVIASGVGDINEGDVFMAKSADTGHIIAFESKVPTSVAKLAVTEGVEIETFNIIYKLFDYLTELIKKEQAEILGEAEILASFPFNKKQVAGCKVTSGVIKKTDELILKRDKKQLGRAKIISMKREKKNIDQAKSGEEFGVVMEPQLDFEVGDMLTSVRQDK